MSDTVPLPDYLPQWLINRIGEYGMARSDGVSDVTRLERWEHLIAGIKGYANDHAAARSAADNAALRAENEQLRQHIEVPTIDRGSQNWKALDGATAFHLIERHADGWADVAQMMDEWLEARTDTLSKRVEELEGASQWRPIETAPKDGRKMLLTYKNRNGKRRTVVGGWVTDEEAAETDTDGVGLEAGWYERIDNWDDYYQVAIHQGEPDYWMPLPSQPKEPK